MPGKAQINPEFSLVCNSHKNEMATLGGMDTEMCGQTMRLAKAGQLQTSGQWPDGRS
jgi:hypothetical protein